jgi:hypothetical protein
VSGKLLQNRKSHRNLGGGESEIVTRERDVTAELLLRQNQSLSVLLPPLFRLLLRKRRSIKEHCDDLFTVIAISSSSHEQSNGRSQDINLPEHGFDIKVSGIIETVSSLVRGGRGVKESMTAGRLMRNQRGGRGMVLMLLEGQGGFPTSPKVRKGQGSMGRGRWADMLTCQ